MTYTAGSVSARIELDTSGFDAKIKDLQGKIDALKVQLQNTGLMDVNKEIKRLQEQLKTQSKTIDDYKKQLKSLREGNRSLNKSIEDTVKTHKSNAESLKTETKTLDTYVKKQKEQVKSNEEVTKSLKKQEAQAKKTSRAFFQKQNGELKKAYRQYSPDEVDFMADIYSRAKVAKNAGKNKISARGIMELPTMREILNLRYPEEGYFGSKNIPSIESLDTDLYKEWKKETQTRMRNLIDAMDLSMSKDRFGDTSSLKVWNEAKGIFETLGTIDISKMPDFGSVAEFRKELENTVNITKVLKEQQARYDAELENSTNDATKLNAEVSKLGSNKCVDEVTIDVKKLGEAEVKTTKETAKLNQEVAKLKKNNGAENTVKNIEKITTSEKKAENETTKLNREVSKLGNNKNVEKTTEAFTKLNVEQRKAGLEAKRNARIFDNMKLEAFKYIDGLKRGLNRNGVVGTDTALWTQFKGQKERTRTFDLDRYYDHMRKTFAGTVPDDIFNDMFRRLNKLYKIGWVGWTADRGGIPEGRLNTLRISADVVKSSQKKRRGYRSSIDEYLGLPSVRERLSDRNIAEASKAMNTFDRSLKTTVVDYNAIEKANEKLNKSVQKTRQFLKENDNGWNTNQQYLHKVSNALQTATNEYRKYNMEVARLSKGYKTYNQTSPINLNSYLGNIKQINQKTSVFDTTASQIQKASLALTTFNRMLKSTNVELELYGRSNLLGDISKNPFIRNAKQNLEILKAVQRRVKTTQVDVQGFQSIYDSMGKTFSTNNANINNAKNVLKLFDGGVEKSQARLKAYELQTKATFETMQVELAKANAAQYKYWKQVRGTADVKGYNQLGTLDVGINQYYGQIDRITAKLAEFKRQQQSVNTNLNQTYSSFEKASQGVTLLTAKMEQYERVINKVRADSTTLGNRIRTLGAEITTLSNKSTQNQIRLTNESRAVQSLGTRLKNLSNWYKQGKISATEYQEGISKLDIELQKLKKQFSSVKGSIDGANRSYTTANAEIRRLAQGYKQNEIAAKQTGTSVKQSSNAMTGAAHSGRILSNTLYQIRGALLSLKMIFTAMGGMALWGFAADLAEGVKETFTAKNEMEAQLKQNKHVGSGGIAYFNDQLDQMTSKFKKINKYSIGETVSSIGLEFDLNARQMAESLDIVSMIQSEYVRAGRKEDEAALAVKDILQGEFQRLSRETGVGKEELVAYGWDEDKTNIDGLLKALRKAALDRHWDIFAKKATSLNDVMTITKSRFSEAGADLMQSATPMIVGAFNTIIDTIDSLKGAFGELSPFMQNATLITGGTGLIGGLLTTLPMVTKGMGLADIATIGWGKSILTAALNLNKAEVAQYGFKKALAATISGTKASELANMRASKAIFGRLLGVKQSVLAEHGYLTALVQSKGVLKNHTGATNIAKISSMGFAQKLAYLTNNMKLQEAQTMGTAKAVLRFATSWKVLRVAILGVMGIGLIAWFASVAAWTDKVKGYVDTFKNVASDGKYMLKDAQSTVKDYEKSLTKLKKGTDAYARAENNLKQAQWNVKDLEAANKRVAYYKKINKERKTDIKLSHQTQLADTYKKAGKNNREATELATGYTHQVAIGQYYINKSLDEYNNRLYKASQHMNEHVDQLKKAGVNEEARVRYIDEYNIEAENAAELWKKFNQGDLNSGIYAVLSELKLVWIDISSRPEVVKLMEDLGKAFNDMKPALKDISKMLEDVFLKLVNFFDGLSQNKELMGAVPWIGLGTGILFAGKKIYNFLGGSKSTIDILKTLGGKLKDGVKKWRNWGNEAKDATEKAGMSDKSTGGINGDIDKTKAKTPFKDTLKNDAKNYARAAIGIVAGMVLITEAIYLLKAPMWSLAEVGKDFKAQEPQIREGIEGLQLIAPVMAVLLPPVVALSLIMDKYASFTQILKGAGKAALGIAAGMILVAETIYLLKAPMWAIGQVGEQYAGTETQVQKGTKAMQVVGDSLKYLAPFIPIFIGGIALVALAFAAPEIGLPVLGAVAMGIAAGMLLLTEAIVTLNAPLEAIKEIGDRYPDISGVQQGAEAIKATSEALKYVSDAMGYLTLIDLNLLVQNIAEVVSKFLGFDLTGNLTKLTEEGGVLDQLNEFTTEFNKITVATPDPDKVTALATAGDGIKTVGDAMGKVKAAMANMPDEFKNKTAQTGQVGNQLGITGNNSQKSMAGSYDDTEGYFDTFKEPIRQLKKFVDEFNDSDDFDVQPINPERVANLSTTADMIGTVNDAVQKVKTTMQNIGDSGNATAFAEGGWFGQIGYNLLHMTGEGAINNGSSSGNYKSSLGSQLQEMEDVVSDIFTFQSNINSMSGGQGENANVDGATAMVTTIQDAISKLSQSLSNAVPTFEGKGNAISQAIIKGINTGLNNIPNIPAKIANKIMNSKETLYATATSLGKTTANKFKQGADPMDQMMGWELYYVNQQLTGEWYDKIGTSAYNLGSHASSRYQDGLDMHSPGLMARATQDEVNYIGDALSINNLPQMAYDLANSLTSNFNPQFSLSNLQFPDISQWTSKLGTIPSMVSNVKTQVSTSFNNMGTNIGTSLQGIATNAQTKYQQIVSTTRSSLGSMKSATLKNIGNIKTSWRGMQDALIASAENIKSQTSSKINTLKTNLGQFWNKIKHPDQLISGAAGGKPTGTIRRRSVPHIRSGFAGSPLFKPRRSTSDPGDYFKEAMECQLKTGKPCYAGGWNFNWTNKIKDKFNGWNTHFNKYNLDSHLNVGKFNNSNFPVKGAVDVFKDYVMEVIRGTSYDFYFNEKYSTPAEALRAGSFNCFDGTRVILALANAFGLGGGGMGHGTWSGTNHVWANIPGIGVIDPTAIQRGYGFKSPKVKGYGAGSRPRKYASKDGDERKVVHNHGDTVININAPVYGVDDLDRAIENGVNKANRKLFRNSYSGV